MPETDKQGRITWFIPAFANSKVGSSCGIVDEEGTKVCSCFSTKKSTNICRKSFADKLGSITEEERNLIFDILRKTPKLNKEFTRTSRKHQNMCTTMKDSMNRKWQ